MSPRLEFAIETVYNAGKSTLALFDTAIAPDIKPDGTPVTVADRQAEAIIRRAIRSKFPAEGILGEEEGESGSQAARWVVDPIDGTKSFICGVPLYATLLSYEEQGVPLVGVCYLPALDKMLCAEVGAGTYCNGMRCKVSQSTSLDKAVICCGGHSSMEKCGRTAGFLKLANRALTTRTWSDAFGHALVAMGKADAMVDPVLKRWDISAMQIIVEEAGGRFTSFAGSTNPQDQAISTNGVLHETILSAFRS